NRRGMEELYEHKIHDEHGDEFACTEIRSLFSGMPRELRERARLGCFRHGLMIAAKTRRRVPSMLLRAILHVRPCGKTLPTNGRMNSINHRSLAYLKASEAYNLQGQFGFDKTTQTDSEWGRVHGK